MSQKKKKPTEKRWVRYGVTFLIWVSSVTITIILEHYIPILLGW